MVARLVFCSPDHPPVLHYRIIPHKMRWSHLLSSTLALAEVASARRTSRHVGNFEKRLERGGRAAPAEALPLTTRENLQHAGKRDNTTGFQFLTDSTASECAKIPPRAATCNSAGACKAVRSGSLIPQPYCFRVLGQRHRNPGCRLRRWRELRRPDPRDDGRRWRLSVLLVLSVDESRCREGDSHLAEWRRKHSHSSFLVHS